MKKTVEILPPETAYRLTLSAEAFALAIKAGSPIAGFFALHRPDGRWDVGVKLSVADQLKQIAEAGENLSDTVVRVIKRGRSPNEAIAMSASNRR